MDDGDENAENEDKDEEEKDEERDKEKNASMDKDGPVLLRVSNGEVIDLEPPEVDGIRRSETSSVELTPSASDSSFPPDISPWDGPSDLRQCIDEYGKAVMQCAVPTSDTSDKIAADILTAIEKTLACHRREIDKVVEGSRMMYDQVAGELQNARAKIGELEKRVEVEQALAASLKATCDRVMAEKLTLDNEVAKQKEEAENDRKERMDLFMGTTSKNSKGG
jgi:hypothetical protein